MLDAQCEKLAQLFQMLSHPTRLCIVNILRHGEVCVSHLQAALGRPQPNISQHLALLRDAGIVACQQEGLYVYYHLTSDQARLVLTVLLGPPGQHAQSDEVCCRRSQGSGDG